MVSETPFLKKPRNSNCLSTFIFVLECGAKISEYAVPTLVCVTWEIELRRCKSLTEPSCRLAAAGDYSLLSQALEIIISTFGARFSAEIQSGLVLLTKARTHLNPQ